MCPNSNGRQIVMNRLAVTLLIVVQTARNPTPITVAALTSKAHKPPTLTPQRGRDQHGGNQGTNDAHRRPIVSRDSYGSESSFSQRRETNLASNPVQQNDSDECPQQ